MPSLDTTILGLGFVQFGHLFEINNFGKPGMCKATGSEGSLELIATAAKISR